MTPEQIKAMNYERTIDQLSNEVKSKVEVIHQYLKHIEQLEAEKAEILEVMRKLLSSHRTFTFGESFSVNDTPIEIEAHTLIQKHAKK